MRRVLVVTIIVLAALLRFVHRAGSIHGILEDQQKGEKFRKETLCPLQCTRWRPFKRLEAPWLRVTRVICFSL